MLDGESNLKEPVGCKSIKSVPEDLERGAVAQLLVDKIKPSLGRLREGFERSRSRDNIGHFFLDDLLPEEIVLKLFERFPKPSALMFKDSLRERKYIGAQMNLYHKLLEEVLYAFQDLSVLELVGDITGLDGLEPDADLYAGGLSRMEKGNFLNPHLDNSHDKARVRWRALNLLYYVTPSWQPEYGGNLELWPNGVSGDPITIVSRFNRLVVMETHNESWHSVSQNQQSTPRCCVSNYYFSPKAVRESDTFHVTSFRGRPEQKWRDLTLQLDCKARMAIRKVFKKGIVENPHVYRK